MDNLNLRRAKKSDYEKTYRIKYNSIKEYVEKIWDWDELQQREIHKKKFIASDTKLIEYKKQEIGYIILKETINEIFIENLLIEKEFQNLGIGKEIMERIIERSNSEKIIILLQVFKMNTKALKFYRSLGFEEIFKNENHIEMKKNWLQ